VAQREDLRVLVPAARREQPQQHGPSPCHNAPRHMSTPPTVIARNADSIGTTAPTSMDEVFGSGNLHQDGRRRPRAPRRHGARRGAPAGARRGEDAERAGQGAEGGRAGGGRAGPLLAAWLLLALYPDEDLPGDFDDNRDVHYSELGKPLDATEFTDGLRRCLGDGLTRLDQSLAKGTAGGVRIITRQGSPWVSVPKRLPRGVRVHRGARLQALAAAEEHRRDPALRPGPGLAAWPRLEKILKKGPVNWELISRNYDCGAAIAGNGWFETDATVRSGEFKVFHPERTVALPFPVSRRLSGGWPVCACSVAGLPAREPADCRLARWKASSKTAEPAMADEPGGDVEEPVEGVNGEQAGGCPAAAQRPGDADHAGQDETL
jgi:hypothetical protein